MVDFEENVEEMVGTTREAADGDRVRRGRDGDETGEPGGPGDETGGVMYVEEGPYTIDVRHLCLAKFCNSGL